MVEETEGEMLSNRLVEREKNKMSWKEDRGGKINKVNIKEETKRGRSRGRGGGEGC